MVAADDRKWRRAHNFLGGGHGLKEIKKLKPNIGWLLYNRTTESQKRIGDRRKLKINLHSSENKSWKKTLNWFHRVKVASELISRKLDIWYLKNNKKIFSVPHIFLVSYIVHEHSKVVINILLAVSSTSQHHVKAIIARESESNQQKIVRAAWDEHDVANNCW